MKQLLHSVIDGFYRLLEVILVVSMIVMFVLVFINVMLRLLFNTGIDLAEELPRFAFVWMCFVGAVVGMRRHSHLGVDMVVAALPVLGRKVCWGISQAIMAVCSLYMLYGTWLQHTIIKENVSAVMQVSMLWVYGISYLTGIAITVICLANLFRLFFGHVDESELIDVQEEGLGEAHEIEQELAEHPAREGAKV
ncbi:TRAP transporter small permease [Propionivibrio soli]|jgi:TRAP-type C4-dicarboxylate transport system permease small subunit|uniref:TRAP transporter small permease n=1 Tax=Propionivibrio soli TaxID=2976531 RepID=UPI0021E93E92|nr:TRAP transporter small permease [Propionivibrio soli]